MFSQTVQYYDKIYAFKDYCAETERLIETIKTHLHSHGNQLLEVACGTGLHIQHLKAHFRVEGLDLDPQMIEIAQQRNPGIPFHCGNMIDFDLGRSFDIITCLFSSIGYAKTLPHLFQAIATMGRHLLPGGLLIVEPWFTPQDWRPNTTHGLFIDEPDLKIARINTSFVEGRLSYFDLHYLIGTPEKTEHVVEHHELGLFTREEMTTAFNDAGLEVHYDPAGLMDRGLYIGKKG